MINRKNKTICLYVLATAIALLFSACGRAGGEQNPPAPGTQESNLTAENDSDAIAETTDADSASEKEREADRNVGKGGGILIAYFTAAENSGVDAVSSASYSMINGEAVGRIRAVADMFQEQTGGELFSIQTSTVYPADGGALIDQAAEEQDDDFRPELITHIENLDDYAVIFVGFPNMEQGFNSVSCA